MRGHVYPLDAVRFFAALCVMFFHLSFYDWASRNSIVGHMFNRATSYAPIAPFTSFGWMGVEIFFVISGFVIANSANNATPMAFAKSRVLRLYPAVWICAFFTLATWLLVGTEGSRHLTAEFVRSLTLAIFGPWLDGVYWSLAVELVFYAIILGLLLLHGFNRLAWAAWALLLTSGAYLVTAALRPILFAAGAGADIAVHDDILQLRYGAFFALGIWMWLFNMRALKRSDWIGIALALMVGVIEIVGRAHEMAASEVRAGIRVSDIAPELVWLAAVAFMFVVVRMPARFAPKSTRVQGLLEQLGKMTYPLYLTHSVVGAFLIREMVHAGVDKWAALAIAIATMLTLAYVVARFGEPAVRKALRALWERAEAALRSTRALAFLFKPGGAAA